MSFWKILIVVCIGWLIFWFGMMPMDQWLGDEILQHIHYTMRDKSLIEYVFLENQDLWFGLTILAVLIFGGLKIANEE